MPWHTSPRSRFLHGICFFLPFRFLFIVRKYTNVIFEKQGNNCFFLEETRKRLFHREYRLHVPFAENLLEAFLVHVVDTGEAREVPGVLVVVDGDGVALVKDDVACVGVDLLVVTRKTARQVGHLLEVAVVVHIEREVALRKEFGEGLGGGIFFERCREGGIVHMDFEFHGRLRLSG